MSNDQKTAVLTAPASAEKTATPSNPPIKVGLLVWATLLIIAGLMLLIIPSIGVPFNGVSTVRAVVVTLFALAGAAFLILAFYISRRDKSQDADS